MLFFFKSNSTIFHQHIDDRRGRGRNSFLCVTRRFLMNAKMGSTHPRRWPWLSGGMSSLSPFVGQWCLPGAIQRLLPTSTLTCPTVLLQKAAQMAEKTRRALWASANIHPTLWGRCSRCTIHTWPSINTKRRISQELWSHKMFRGF